MGERVGVEAAERPVSNQCGDVSFDGLTCALERGHTCVHMRGLGGGRASYWAVGFDTGGPQGPPPTSSPEGSEGGGAGLDLDRLARLAEAAQRYTDRFADGEWWLATDFSTQDFSDHEIAFWAALDPRTVLALVERVKALEVVAAWARDEAAAGLPLPKPVRAALAAAGGSDGQ